VAVVDTDPQGSLADWWNQRRAETPIFASVEVVHSAAHMAELRQQRVNLVVIDTPPALLQEAYPQWQAFKAKRREVYVSKTPEDAVWSAFYRLFRHSGLIHYDADEVHIPVRPLSSHDQPARSSRAHRSAKL
jgi:hypothetical protein